MLLLSDGSDLKDVRRVEDIKYWKILRLSMRLIFAWPTEEPGYIPTTWDKIGRHVLLLINLVCFVFEVLYLSHNIGKISFFELGHTYITAFMTVVATSRNLLTYQKSYGNIFREFAAKIHLFNVKDDSEYAMKIHIMIHKICHFFTIYINLMVINGIFLFNATPLYNNFSRGSFRDLGSGNATLEQAVYYQLPFDYTTNFKGYMVVFFANWYLSVSCSIYFCSIDLYLSLVVFHVWGQLKIFIYNLENFPRPKTMTTFTNIDGYPLQNERYSEEETKQVFVRLRDLVKHHCLIISFITKMSKTFGFILFVYLCFHQVCGCILLLECSSMEPSALTRYGPLTVIIFQQLIQVSLIFELLGSMTDSLIKAVYNLPWECMESRYRRIVHVLLMQVQLPLKTKALDMVDVGSGTMVTILKTSLSYFVMLQTFSSRG